ncbi:MAG: hypothetical protein R6V01_02275 [Thermoplasmatota archaeon]
MAELVLQGEMLFFDGWSEATVTVEDGRIVHFSDGLENTGDAAEVKKGLIFPGLLDMHTHLGDHGARGDLPSGLKECVFPGGMKHRFLERCTLDELVISIKRSLEELHHGVTFVMDYREGGSEGLQAILDALYEGAPRVYSMGRAAEGGDISGILENADGLGIPSLREGLSYLREMARKEHKPFSIHASELFREDIGSIIELEPDQLVHMVSGTEDDWRAVSDKGIPVVVCPRSNMTFNIDVPLHRMLDSGLSMTLGTDNSISSMHDIFREMEFAWILLRKGGPSGTEAARSVFSMAVGRTMDRTDLIGMLPDVVWWWEKDWPRRGDPSNLFTVKEPSDDLWKRDPYTFAVRFLDRSRLSYTGSL